MPQPYGVLLIPADSDPHGLLEEGPCQSRPPKVWAYGPWLHELSTLSDSEQDRGNCAYCGDLWPCRQAGQEEGGRRWVHGGMRTWPNKPTPDHTEALVLAWDGKVTPEGMDRAARIWEANTEEESRGLEPYNLWWCQLVDAQNLAAEMEAHGLGLAVEVDADGKVIG